jgi:hypothetical protein
MPRQARLQRTTRYVDLSRGVKKRWMKGGPVSIDGVDYTPQEILDELASLTGAIDDAAQAYAAWRAKLAAQRKLEKAQRTFVNLLGIAVRLKYGKDPEVLADFGMEPPKKTGPKTPEVKAEAVVKGKATRAKRGTMGKNQRKKVKGE